MKNLAILLMCGTLTVAAHAATVNIQWQHPDKYTDVQAGEGSQQAFQKRVFSQLDKHFAKLAKKLPADQQLNIKVTNLDLAGDVNFGNAQRIRIVRDIFIPRMVLSYQLLDSSGKTLKKQQVKLQDLSFMNNISLKYQNDSLGYEKNMIDNWFKKTFLAS